MHVQNASADVLLQRLEGVQKSGNGWRAYCPACGGRSRKLSVTVRDNRVLINCFACNDAGAVLAAIGLTLTDLHPPRHWPQSPEERRNARRAIREAGLLSALEVLSMEGAVIEAAGRQLSGWQYLSVEDDARLSLAVERASHARIILSEAATWRPNS
jgi:hypothetical protein